MHNLISPSPKTEFQLARMEHIARTCHEVNRAYCLAMRDFSQAPWDMAPDYVKASVRLGVEFHLSGDFGPEASHAEWMRHKALEGWGYGPVKNPDAKEHPCMVPFDKLPIEQQVKDHLFRAVVRALKD
jgi:hypothetical protein